ncbi:MAG: hypothetical protein DHS20C17_12750 [Cyclobacteriaceae bacterium]|nr:MAG: hypothetical protein DHS20C17_12750 [Cyclobacteriaceae bacterium]
MSRLILVFTTTFIICAHLADAQTIKSPLSRVINVSSTSQIAPSLSGDGKHMIYTSTSNLKSELLVFYAYQQRPGKWTQPEPITVINRSLQINHIGGYSLSYDGNYIFFTSRKSYGIGKYDIWYCKRTAKNQWSEPVNLAKPVNSTLDDGCPSPSPDGKTLYFVRCQSMDQKEGTGCKLMMAEKKNQELWGEPVELPKYINDGNIMSPRILADNQTLIYAKGQGDSWDLYQSRLVTGQWSKPVPLDYVNTSGDERFSSVPAQGDVIYYSTKFKGTYDIIKAKIPQEFQPLKVVYLKGQVTDKEGTPLEAFIQIYDVESKQLIQYDRTASDQSGFEFYLASGRQYDFSIVPHYAGYAFYSEIYDLRELEVSTRNRLDIELEKLEAGNSFLVRCLSFENDSTLNNLSRFELSRIIKLFKNNPGTKFEIGVHRDRQEPDTLLFADTTFSQEPTVSESSLDVVDSVEMQPEDKQVNLDPTEIQAQAILTYLQERGVPEYVVETKGYADTQPIIPEDAPEEQQVLNRRIEVRVID